MNYGYVALLPNGWRKLASEMLEKIMKIDPTYEILDMKEKWGKMDVFSITSSDKYDEISAIENEYTQKSAHTCCKCGNPATKQSKGWILPFCDNCGTESEDKYVRF